MDPRVTLATILDPSVTTAERAQARRDLNKWLTRGGFGPRVESHPATDAWIMGDRYGTVVKVGAAYVHVRMDRSGRVRKFPFRDVLAVN